MSATNTFENRLLRHIFLNESIPNIGNSNGLLASAVDGSLYVALLTANPTESGSTTNEANYSGYTRIEVGRSTTGWTVTNNNVSNAIKILYPPCIGGNNTITHFSIMTADVDGDMLLYGELVSALIITNGITPEFIVGNLNISVD